jgi:glyoxylase-like metal-dependent hydrolase (beta-lactamase superfamily II)
VVGAARLRVVVLLTAPWHERSTRAFVARYGAAVWAARPARSRIADLTQLDNLPAGIAAFAPGGVDEGQVAFVFEEERTIVVAEFLLGTPSGLEVLPAPATSDLHELLESLQELERLPIERVLVSHGPPVLNRGREAIAAALRSFQDAR